MPKTNCTPGTTQVWPVDMPPSQTPCTFWASASLPGHWWPPGSYPLLGGSTGREAGTTPGLQRNQPVELKQAMPPASSRNKQGASSWDRPTAAGQAGRKVHEEGQSPVHTMASPHLGLWPGPVAGTGPAPPPFLLWHLPGTGRVVGSWDLRARQGKEFSSLQTSGLGGSAWIAEP